MKLFMCVNEDHCVICGDYVPEGRMVCAKCEEEMSAKHHKTKFGKETIGEDRRKKIKRGKIRLEEVEE